MLYPHKFENLVACSQASNGLLTHTHTHSLSLRHVMLPKEIAQLVPRGRLMSEKEWRGIGVQQSPGWIHYMIHGPEPHVLLFRRPITNQQAATASRMM